MSDTTPEATAPETPVTDAQEPAAATPEPTAEAPKAGNPWEDPAVAKAEIERLRRENASSRTNAKATAAEEARKELAQQIGKALGLVQDEAVDPAELTQQLTKAQQEQRQAALELAIYRATPDAAVANALLDSRTFLATVSDLDPNDGTAIAAAVGEAVQNIPALGKRLPAPIPGQGSSGSGPATAAQLTASDLKNMTPEQIVEAQTEGRLDHLLGRR